MYVDLHSSCNLQTFNNNNIEFVQTIITLLHVVLIVAY